MFRLFSLEFVAALLAVLIAVLLTGAVRWVLLFCAVLLLVLWLRRVPSRLSKVQPDGVLFWAWAKRQFVPWQDFTELAANGSLLLFRTEQAEYVLNLQVFDADTAKDYFDRAAAHVPMNAELQAAYAQAQAEQQQTIAYADWPLGEAVELPLQIRVKPQYIALIGTGSLVSLFPSVVLFLGGDALGAGVALLIGLIGPAILVWLLTSSCRIDAQGLQLQTLLGRYRIAWDEVEQLRAAVDQRQLGNLLVIEGKHKRLVLNLGIYQDQVRFRQAVLQVMAQHGIALKQLELRQVRTRNAKI